jgi:hypothetical protein
MVGFMERFLEIRQRALEIFDKINKEISVNGQFADNVNQLDHEFKSLFSLLERFANVVNALNSLPLADLDEYMIQVQHMVETYAKY